MILTGLLPAPRKKITIEGENVAIDRLNASQGTIAKAKAVFANMGVDGVFGRSDIATITKNKDNARYRPYSQ